MKKPREWFKRFLRISFIFAVVAAVLFGPVYFFTSTPAGIRMISEFVLNGLFKEGEFLVSSASGSLREGFILNDIRAVGHSVLPRGGEVLIGTARVKFRGFLWREIDCVISSGMLVVPGQGSVNFQGRIRNGILDLSVDADTVDLGSFSSIPDLPKELRAFSGGITDLELNISGPLNDPVVEGGFALSNLEYSGYFFDKGLCRIKTRMGGLSKTSSAGGSIEFKDVTCFAKDFRDIEVDIGEGSVVFVNDDPGSLIVKVSRAGVRSAVSEPVFFYGEFSAGRLDFNIYSRRVNINILMSLLGLRKMLNGVGADLEDADLYLRGTVDHPEVRGRVRVKQLSYRSFSLVNAPLEIKLAFAKDNGKETVKGEVKVLNGSVAGQSSVVIRLVGEGLVSFTGDGGNPGLNLSGESTVAGTRINAQLRGTLREPDLRLSSTPPMARERLLVMLITGKKWQGADRLLTEGIVSPDLAVDFLDYFVFNGAGSNIARRLGMSGLSVTVDEHRKGFELKKPVHEKVEVGYGIIQTKTQEKNPEVTQKISGEVKVTGAVSVSAERELKQSYENNDPQGESQKQKPKDEVLIKFKKEF